MPLVGSPRMSGSVIRRGVVAMVAAAAVWLLAPGAALADECSIDSPDSDTPGTSLYDSQGYEFDVYEPNTPSSEYDQRTFAALEDGGSHGPVGNPVGVRNADDSWDEWGSLYIGSTADDAPLNTAYSSFDDNSCTREDGGRELVFPQLTVNGLLVQRKLFVPASGLPGGRILTLVTNPSGSPVTTTVQYSSTNDNDGDLGSDNQTGVRSSSSGDATFTPADLWAVTSDHAFLGGTVNSDLALAHVVDGSGGSDRVDHIVAADPSTELDNLVYRWDNITILPGQTAAIMAFEVQQGVPDGNASAEDAAAAAAAQQVEFQAQAGSASARAATSPLYSGMSLREIGSLRNWPTNLHCFGRTPTIVGNDPANDKLVGTNGPDVIMAFGGKDKISGLGGKDRICAAGGKDTLQGGGGKDLLDGGPGKDRLVGGKGKDTCLGGKGKDKAAGCEREKKIP
jgi:Ca2+-binding RTX toxin-like protein